jgi:sortase A
VNTKPSGKRNPDDLTEAEIRYLLSAKLRSASQPRLERFRRTGRRLELVPDDYSPALETLYTTSIESNEEIERHSSIQVRRRPVDKVLVFIEVIAIIGFVYFVVNGFGLHHLLNREISAAMEQPALTPTPLISALVLPSGHVHIASSSDTQQDKGGDIPKHLRPLVQSQVNLPLPTPAPEHGIRIQIPAIDVDAPIVHGDDEEQLKKGVAHNAASVNPGQQGNIVLSGHNDVFGEVFRYLERLKPGDEIVVYTSRRSFTYVVSGWELVEPTQVEVMSPTPDATITLISCHPYLVDNHRIIVKGSLAG